MKCGPHGDRSNRVAMQVWLGNLYGVCDRIDDDEPRKKRTPDFYNGSRVSQVGDADEFLFLHAHLRTIGFAFLEDSETKRTLNSPFFSYIRGTL